MNPAEINIRHTRAFALRTCARRQDWQESAQEYQRFVDLARGLPAERAKGLAEMGLLLARLEMNDGARSSLAESLQLDTQYHCLDEALRQQVTTTKAALEQVPQRGT